MRVRIRSEVLGASEWVLLLCVDGGVFGIIVSLGGSGFLSDKLWRQLATRLEDCMYM